ncbi:SDR family NAD(P)-dependent oxidoreductase [Kitasatospora sp. CM 4170]|uniref:SDR family NAD(P)-dependent oxidoreductase n=1 Tax=Kitasatospora aburaviensis TaxID=67265 RepID=A0ABW1F9E4_9ACTN|nr:SDR family NAD(P)-dependent oxidoreductase [Kitasatospora sp. CM 4170]WNM49731.1 SDR family NAD(P)-dependent oxidoreductase [Kitasatospora sp. CM 4170]
MVRRWLVTGCSSGLGRALVAAAAAAGDVVVATARRTGTLDGLVRTHPDRVLPLALDVRDPAQCEAAVAAATDRVGGLDVLVNNAGNGVFGTVEEVADDELRDQLETLVVGPWRLSRLVLPLMRAQGAGDILNISSLAGRMAFPGLAAYVTGKYALEGMTQALAAEAAPFGIRVSALEPGGYATRYGTSLTDAAGRSPLYAAFTDPMRGLLGAMAEGPTVGSAEEFARTVLRIVATPGPLPVRIPVGPGSHAYVEAAAEAAAAELTAARALLDGTPS